MKWIKSHGHTIGPKVKRPHFQVIHLLTQANIIDFHRGNIKATSSHIPYLLVLEVLRFADVSSAKNGI